MKRVLVTGGSGFIGRRLANVLAARGDQVTVLSRDAARARQTLPSTVRVAGWAPQGDGPWLEELGVVDAVVHLAGELVVQRWNDEKKRRIETSRVASTERLVEAIGKSPKRPTVLVSASAIGYYGNRAASEKLDEDAEPGTDFLAGVVQRWEAAARAVEQHGVRSVQLRIGIVLGEDGGALAPMVRAFRLYTGGPLGDGTQIVSWIHRDDLVDLFLLAIDDPSRSGPMNAVAPNPVTNAELARALGAVLSRPAWFRTPAAALRLAFGEAADVVLGGQWVVPKRAVEAGYAFRYPRLVPALESILGG